MRRGPVLLALLLAGCAPRAEPLLARIEAAEADYRLADYYDASRTFLRHHPRHPRAARVAYGLALQLATENLVTPRPAEVAEAHALLRRVEDEAEDPALRFEAALLAVKFAPPAERIARGEAMLARFADGPREQVYFFLVHEALAANELPRAGRHAAALLAERPALEDRAPYERVVRRAAKAGTLFPGAPPRRAIVDFWASWCEPCAAAIPRLEALAQRHELAILGVSLDEEEAPYARFLEAHPAAWPNRRDPALAAAMGVAELPTYFLLSAEGRILETELGLDALEAALTRP